MRNKDILSIGEAAEFLGVAINTLRNWDASGKLKALKSQGGHRIYLREQLERFNQDLVAVARIWAESPQASSLPSDHYCETQDTFRARLDRMASAMHSTPTLTELAPLLTAVTGEIGNNSFDHNIGSWPDAPGIFYAFDNDKRVIVLADRGQGIKSTLLRVRPLIKDDIMALRIAFTERISGRAPEQRGNGLKFVRDVAIKHSIGVFLQSGTAIASMGINKSELEIGLAQRFVRGTLTRIIY